MRKRVVEFTKYKSIYSDDEYYALLDPVTKPIEGINYIEVTTSLDIIKPLFVRADSIVKIGKAFKEF